MNNPTGTNDTVITQVKQTYLVPANDLAFIAKVMADIALPATRLKVPFWERTNGNLSVTLNAGAITVLTKNGYAMDSYLPYGKYARAIMKHLVEQSKKTCNPEIDLGATTYALIKQLGLSRGGVTYKDVFNQLQAVLVMNVKVSMREQNEDEVTGDTILSVKDRFVRISDYQSFRVNTKTGEFTNEGETNIVRLSPEFMELFVANAVPISCTQWEHLLKNTNTPMALDIFSWLWARGRRWQGVTRISWESLYEQFGTTADIRNFRRTFKAAMKEVYEHTSPSVNVGFAGEGKRTGFRGVVITPAAANKGAIKESAQA